MKVLESQVGRDGVIKSAGVLEAQLVETSGVILSSLLRINALGLLSLVNKVHSASHRSKPHMYIDLLPSNQNQ